MRAGVVAIKQWWERRRQLIGKFAFELVIVFIGVTAAFALEYRRQEASESRYRKEMIAALLPTLDDVIGHNAEFDAEVTAKLAAFDAAIAAGQQPELPIFREDNSERPPTRAWDGLIASGAARALAPELFFRFALFYTRQESVGERYIRYNDFTEQRVYPLGRDASAFYDTGSGQLKPEFAAHVDRLRDLQKVDHNITLEAVELRDELAAME